DGARLSVDDRIRYDASEHTREAAQLVAHLHRFCSWWLLRRSQPTILGCSHIARAEPPVALEVAAQELQAAAADLAPVVGPDPLPPISVAARLGHEEVEERVAVAVLARRDAGARHRFAEQRAQLLHVAQDVLVAADPGDIVRPAPALHVETVVFALEFLDHGRQPLGAGTRAHAVPDPLLV